MRRRTVVQLVAGLTAGALVPLAVAGALYRSRDGGGPATVRLTPAPVEKAAHKGLTATTGRQIVPALLAPGDLGPGWKIPEGALRGDGGDLAKAPAAVPALSKDCTKASNTRQWVLGGGNPYAWTVLDRERHRLFESATVYREGVGVEAFALIRGSFHRCAVDPATRKGITSSAKVSPGPELGDESLRAVLSWRAKYGGGGTTYVFVRVGDTIVSVYGTTLPEDDERLVAAAVRKIGTRP